MKECTETLGPKIEENDEIRYARNNSMNDWTEGTWQRSNNGRGAYLHMFPLKRPER